MMIAATLREKLFFIAKVVPTIIAIDYLIGIVVLSLPMESTGHPPLLGKAARLAISSVLILFFYYWYLRKFRLLANYSHKNIPKNIGIGFFTALLMILLIAVIAISLSPHKVYFEWPQLYPAFIIFLFQLGNATLEEFIYRGMLQRMFEKFMPVAVAVVLQVAIFTYAHDVQNTNSPFLYGVILVLYGLLFTLLSKFDPSLLCAVACHMTLNWCIYVIFGASNTYIVLEPMWHSIEPARQEVYPVAVAVVLVGWWFYFKRFRRLPNA